MTARRPFRDDKFDSERSAIAETRNTPHVIQFTRKLSAIACFEGVAQDRPTARMARDTQEDLTLPLFPGECWFGG
jgi:hypothetical protein